jgi:hypothetical protein
MRVGVGRGVISGFKLMEVAPGVRIVHLLVRLRTSLRMERICKSQCFLEGRDELTICFCLYRYSPNPFPFFPFSPSLLPPQLPTPRRMAIHSQ